MKKGFDFTGIVVCNLCHDGNGNYVLGFRSEKCRDEHFTWEPTGSGGVGFGELINDAITREVQEELGTKAKKIEWLGFHEALREFNSQKTHWLYIVSKVEVDRTLVKIAEPDKCLEQQWFTKDNFPIPLMSEFPPIIKKFYSKM